LEGIRKKKEKPSKTKQKKKNKRKISREGGGREVKHCNLLQRVIVVVFLFDIFSNLFPIFEGHAVHSNAAGLGALSAVFVPAMTGHAREPIC
jgi:hypothetical protein